MRLFVKLFMIAFVVVIIDSCVSPPPMASEWLVACCVVAALLATLITQRFVSTLPNAADEQFEFEVVSDDEYEELSR